MYYIYFSIRSNFFNLLINGSYKLYSWFYTYRIIIHLIFTFVKLKYRDK